MVAGVCVSVPFVCTQWPEMALAYALTVWSAMAKQRGPAASRGKFGAHLWCRGRQDGDAVEGCGRVAPEAAQCSVAQRRPLRLRHR